MNKFIFVIVYISIIFYSYANTIVLKEKFYTDNNSIKLIDLIEKTDIKDLPEITIDLKNIPCKVYGSDITNLILDKNHYDFIIIGDYVVVHKNIQNNVNDSYLNEKSTASNNPIKFLEEYIGNFFDIKNSKIKITIIKTNPEIDLLNTSDEFKWQVESIKYGLKDLIKLKKLNIKVNDNIYEVNIKVGIYADFYIAKENFLKNDFLKTQGFSVKNTDITVFNDLDNLIFDIDNYKNSQFVKDVAIGEILRINQLKMSPLVKKGENIKYIFNRDNIEITSFCTLLQDGFENEKIKFKLLNGNEKFGIIRKKAGNIYVEIL